jgi:hypothetical protein
LIFLVRGLRRHLGVMLSENSTIVREMILHRDVYRESRYQRYRDLVWEASYRAGSRYHPAAYPGHILLFIAGNLKVDADSDTRLFLCKLARDGCLAVRATADDFGELLKRPHVKALADSLAELLREPSSAASVSSILGIIP